MLKGEVPQKSDRFLIYITGALSDIFKVFYLFLCKVCVSIFNFSSGQHRQKNGCRHLLACAQITGTCTINVTYSRYLEFLFTSSTVDLCMCAGQLSGRTSLGLHYCTSTEAATIQKFQTKDQIPGFPCQQNFGDEGKKGHAWKEGRYVGEYPAFHERRDWSSTNHYSDVCC